ncbi:hypothetical protein HRR83_006987 [Exophiala dermatitidis]|uniref:Aminoglycoside phosphotransferase domain-containing protein n=1 Tax=Exophiala dermatitidis TaxID=5970 RepID=A0AAN6EQH2_EXODE|nr:hypothetical protein HRR75_005823 [Exophiala dermatitidis]KAJ4512471.1 hypothetical protein HRR73_006026 [Exophiala dermatitidis]KAJ4512655.1 hypothetical protein HRR74_006353 [Exophiala dermatitidis]KAJ4542456.1 hypothetical protein HRR77_005657 [Exophiala dermatitidis]KAJ4546610.1 hypothetical protein HRR78_005611 [Exophiala dermatitidis]
MSGQRAQPQATDRKPLSTSKTIRPDWLPDPSQTEVDFRDSAFFKQDGRELPNPPVVDAHRKGIVVVPEMQLVIKHGPNVTIDEALTMWAVRKQLGSEVPVPELYGWRVVNGTVFIYMELVGGVTLEQRWPDMTHSEKEIVCSQLGQMLFALRDLKQGEKGNSFIGSITRGPLLDRVFYYLPKAGPFDNLKDFYDWLEWLPQRYLTPEERFKNPYLQLLPEDTTIKFTHADVHPSNIMVSTAKSGSGSDSSPGWASASDLPIHVLALIDWGQSGWYPDYWEYFKMCYTVDWEGDWRVEWLPKMIEPMEDEENLMSAYTMGIGAV